MNGAEARSKSKCRSFDAENDHAAFNINDLGTMVIRTKQVLRNLRESLVVEYRQKTALFITSFVSFITVFYFILSGSEHVSCTCPTMGCYMPECFPQHHIYNR